MSLLWFQVTDASFSAKGNVLATAGKDGIVNLWDTKKPMPKVRAYVKYWRRMQLALCLAIFDKELDVGHYIVCYG